MSSPPVQRVVLWGLLVATLLGILVTAIMAPKWSASAKVEPPQVLGQVPEFELTNRDGRVISKTDLLGSNWVADFIFTRCGLSCPRLTSLMENLAEAIPEEEQIYRVSISVDPTNDSAEVLQRYAESRGIQDEKWLFLTGQTEEIRSLVVSGFKLALDTEPPAEIANPDEPILHSNRFVLVDGEGAIRGYYNVVESGELQRLIDDLLALS